MRKDICFIEQFFIELQNKNITYCILRNAEEVEKGDAHDIDMTVDCNYLVETENILFATAQRIGWSLHMKIGVSKDKMNIKCYHFSFTDRDNVYIVHFDLFPTFTWNGYILLNNTELLGNINEKTIYHKAAPAVEAVTKLFIRLLHGGYIKAKYKKTIYDIFCSFPEDVCAVLGCFLDQNTYLRVMDAVETDNWKELEKNRDSLVKSIRKNAKCKQLQQKTYLINKVLKRAGLMVVFEGTDGSGKSTVIEGLPLVLSNTFPEDSIDYYHWRPGVIRKKKNSKNGMAVVTEPHAKKPYGKVKSLAKFMFFNLDYIVGYWIKIRWQLSKGHLVIFDRYFYDYYIDKIRYRLSISDKTLNFFKPLIPRPDVTFLLVGDAQTLYERKREIPAAEIKRQIGSLLKNQDRFHNHKIIDANQSIEKVVHNVSVEILNTGTKRYKDS